MILRDNNLSRSIPSELGGFVRLTVLRLFANRLPGALPHEFFSGVIPPENGDDVIHFRA